MSRVPLLGMALVEPLLRYKSGSSWSWMLLRGTQKVPEATNVHKREFASNREGRPYRKKENQEESRGQGRSPAMYSVCSRTPRLREEVQACSLVRLLYMRWALPGCVSESAREHRREWSPPSDRQHFSRELCFRHGTKEPTAYSLGRDSDYTRRILAAVVRAVQLVWVPC